MASPGKNIKMVIFDVDGVLTDGGIIIDAYGIETKKFNVKDGTGIKYLIRSGLQVAFITGRQSMVVSLRAKELGVTDVFQDAKNKMEPYEQLLAKYGLKDEDICYIGDDLPDIPVMRRAGFAAAVSNAPSEVKNAAAFVTSVAGGQGAARELAEKILKDQDKWKTILSRYQQE